MSPTAECTISRHDYGFRRTLRGSIPRRVHYLTSNAGPGPFGWARPLLALHRPLDERLHEELDLLDRVGLRLHEIERADLREGAECRLDRRIPDDRHEVVRAHHRPDGVPAALLRLDEDLDLLEVLRRLRE